MINLKSYAISIMKFFFAMPHGIRNLSFLTMMKPVPPMKMEVQALNHWIAREIP